MAATMLDVGEPARVAQSGVIMLVVRRVPEARRLGAVGFPHWRPLWHSEDHVAAIPGRTLPEAVFADEREDLAIGDRVTATDHREPHVTGHQPVDEGSEQTEGRVGDHHVGRVAKCSDFNGSEVAVALQVLPLQVFDVHTSVARYILRSECEHPPPLQ